MLRLRSNLWEIHVAIDYWVHSFYRPFFAWKKFHTAEQYPPVVVWPRLDFREDLGGEVLDIKVGSS